LPARLEPGLATTFNYQELNPQPLFFSTYARFRCSLHSMSNSRATMCLISQGPADIRSSPQSQPSQPTRSPSSLAKWPKSGHPTSGAQSQYPHAASRKSPSHSTSSRPLQTLHALTPPSLLSLSNLKVVLNEAACHRLTPYNYSGSCCLDDPKNTDCKQKHGGVHQLPLLSPASVGNHGDGLAASHALLEEWHSAAARQSSPRAPSPISDF
jgi:hypothetical protein